MSPESTRRKAGFVILVLAAAAKQEEGATSTVAFFGPATKRVRRLTVTLRPLLSSPRKRDPGWVPSFAEMTTRGRAPRARMDPLIRARALRGRKSQALMSVIYLLTSPAKRWRCDCGFTSRRTSLAFFGMPRDLLTVRYFQLIGLATDGLLQRILGPTERPYGRRPQETAVSARYLPEATARGDACRSQ